MKELDLIIIKMRFDQYATIAKTQDPQDAELIARPDSLSKDNMTPV